MKLPIFAKLFITLLLSTVLIIVAMIATAHWQFRQGFTKYLQQVEAKRLDVLAENLFRSQAPLNAYPQALLGVYRYKLNR